MYRPRGSRVGIIERTFARCLIVRFFLFVRNIIRLLDQFSMKQVFNVRLINVFSTSFFKNSLNYWSIELTLIIIIIFFFQLINESKRFSSRFEVDQKKKKKILWIDWRTIEIFPRVHVLSFAIDFLRLRVIEGILYLWQNSLMMSLFSKNCIVYSRFIIYSKLDGILVKIFESKRKKKIISW